MLSAREQCRYIQISTYKRVPKAVGKTKKKKKAFLLKVNILWSTVNILRSLPVPLEFLLVCKKPSNLQKGCNDEVSHINMHYTVLLTETHESFGKTRMLSQANISALRRSLINMRKNCRSANKTNDLKISYQLMV